MSKSRKIKILIFLVLLLLGLNYNSVDDFLKNTFVEKETGVVERIIDGDTIVISPGEVHVRMLGINTPEKGEKYSSSAKDFLERVILNKTIELKFGKDKTDMYGRTLAYIFYNNANVNLELVDEGFANFYFPQGRDVYYDKFVKAWEHCLENNQNLCKKSENVCANCIKLKGFDNEKEVIVFENICGFACNLTKWGIKDEGRKNFVFPNFILNANNEMRVIVGNKSDNSNELFWKGETYVWTKTGDTLFLRDDEKGLVLWKNY